MRRFNYINRSTLFTSVAALTSTSRKFLSVKPVQWMDVTQTSQYWGLPENDYYTKLYDTDSQFQLAKNKGYLPKEMYAMISREQRDHIAWFFHCIPNAMTMLDQNYLTLPEYLLLKPTADFLEIFRPEFFNAVIATQKIVMRDLISQDSNETKANFEKLGALSRAFLAKDTDSAIKRGYISLDALLSLTTTQLLNFRVLMSGICHSFKTPMDLIDKGYFSLNVFLNAEPGLQEKYARHITVAQDLLPFEQFFTLRAHTQSQLSQPYQFSFLDEKITLDQFDQSSDRDQRDIHFLVGEHGIVSSCFPISSLLALSHETRMLFFTLRYTDLDRGGPKDMEICLRYKFLAELSLHEPEKLDEFKALSYDQQHEYFKYFREYENEWYKNGKQPDRNIIPEKLTNPAMRM